jgi:hypothetical protein
MTGESLDLTGTQDAGEVSALVEQILQLQEVDEEAPLRLQAEQAIEPADVAGPGPEGGPQDMDLSIAPTAETAGTGASGAVDRVVAIARKEVGYREGANNSTKYGKWYGMDRVPWCNIFVSWVFAQAGQAKAIGGKFAYVPAHAAWFRRKGRWGNTPRPGADATSACTVSSRSRSETRSGNR